MSDKFTKANEEGSPQRPHGMFSNSPIAAFVAVAIGVTAFDKIGGEREPDFKGRARGRTG